MDAWQKKLKVARYRINCWIEAYAYWTVIAIAVVCAYLALGWIIQ